MRSYYLSPALARLRDQINELWPDRDKRSDGWIGDPAHAARKSDHNPDYTAEGIVRAIDVDKDGVDMGKILSAVLFDPRTWYVIWNGRIRYGSHVEGVPEGWQPYKGANKHDRHMHISVRKVGRWDRNTARWAFPTPTPATPPVEEEDDVSAEDVWNHRISIETAEGDQKPVTASAVLDRLITLERDTQDAVAVTNKKLDQLLELFTADKAEDTKADAKADTITVPAPVKADTAVKKETK